MEYTVLRPLIIIPTFQLGKKKCETQHSPSFWPSQPRP
jgi:hypothetical protein